MANDVQVCDEECDPNKDQDHPDRQGYHQHRSSAVWSVDSLQMKIASSLTSDCTAHRGGDGFIPHGSRSSLH